MHVYTYEEFKKSLIENDGEDVKEVTKALLRELEDHNEFHSQPLFYRFDVIDEKKIFRAFCVYTEENLDDIIEIHKLQDKRTEKDK